MRIVACAYQRLEFLSVPQPFVLLKTGLAGRGHRWSLLGWEPWWSWNPSCGDPLICMDDVLADVKNICGGDIVCEFPLPAVMGAISYDFGARKTLSVPLTQPSPQRERDTDALLFAMRRVVVMDEVAQCGWEIFFDERVAVSPSERPPHPTLSQRGEGLPQSNFTRDGYVAAIARIQSMIAAGDCYQVNLSQQWTAHTSCTAPELFRRAIDRNPAPMMALVATSDVQIISTSPERLISRRGGQLISEPIKGTIARGSTTAKDLAAMQNLRASAKDRAELAMIIDLVRNDLGRVAQTGSVQVIDAARIESYANVHHLVATIQAQARADLSWAEIFRAMFPGGSITGCPKEQAMQVIAELEPDPRGFYCGSIGYIDARGDGDWNIAIRTITQCGTTVRFNLGGGIVYDSDPAAEYEETLRKGETLFGLLDDAAL